MNEPRMMRDGEVFGVDDAQSAECCFNGPTSMLHDLDLCVKSWRSGDVITAICVVTDNDDRVLWNEAGTGAMKVVRTFPAADIRIVPRKWEQT